MNPNRQGLFNAYPVDIGVTDTGPNNLATAVIQFTLFEELVNGEWVDCSAEGMEVTGYFYLEKKDGQVNTMGVDSLRAALGWQTDDPAWMQQTELSQVPVQVRLATEQHEGKTKIKVKYLNPHGSTGGIVPKGDDKTHQGIRTRLGSKLRAYMGGKPMPAPKPAARTAPPVVPAPLAAPAPAAASASPPPPAAPPSARPPAPTTATMDQAWQEFTKNCQGEKWTQAAVEQEWFRVIAQLFPGKQPEQLSPTEWAVMLEQGPGSIIPF